LLELKRWSEYLDIPLNREPRFFPVNGDRAAYWILAANERDASQAIVLTGAIGRAIWREERDVADEATLADIAEKLGMDAGKLADRAASEEIIARYKSFTAEAIQRKVFGAPTYVYRDELFWGQDRLDFLDRALAK
jgi:2-hydroxychromene-2-carboxylate isomerase